MSKSSTATVPKFPPQLATKSAWAKGPPQHTSAPSPRSQSPVPSNSPAPAHATHSRRPSTLGQGVPIKDGVSVPRSNVGSAKQATAVTFGSIGDVSAPISTSPAAIPAVKSESVKSFGSVIATGSHVNGKSSVSSSSRPSLAPSGSTFTASTTPVSTPSTPSKPLKMDIHKMFQNPSSAPSSHPPSDTASPSVRPLNLPSQQQHQQSSQHQQGQPSAPPSQHSQLGSHPFPPFVPAGVMRTQPQNSGQGGGPPRSPVYSRQMTNGNGPRPPGGPNGPGGQSQMSAGLASPRLGSHPHPGQPSGMPPPPQMPAQMQVPGWPGYYYSGMPADQHYMQPYSGWYVQPQHPLPQHQQHPHHAPPPGPHGPPHSGMPMSPRNPPPQLQGSGTPTLSHAAPNSAHSAHPPPSHSHASSNSISGGLSSPPPTPSTASMPGSARLNTNASAFVPGGRKSVPITMKSADGTEVKLEHIVKKQSPGMGAGVTPLPPSPSPGSGLGVANSNGAGSTTANRRSIRIESVDAQQKRLAEEQEKEKEKARTKAEAEEKARKEKEEKEMKEKEEVERKKREEEAEQERIRKEEKDRIRVEEERKEQARKEEEERERVRKEEERKKKEEEEREQLRKEEEEREKEKERLRIEVEEEKERIRKEEDEKEAQLKAAAEEADYKINEPEEGEVAEAPKEDEVKPVEVQELVIEKPREKESLRIDTAAATSPQADFPKKRPGRLDLSSASKGNIPAGLPSALATARVIDDLGVIPYPEGVMSPKLELNVNAKDGKFRYDRDFLLQFMSICKEKPDMLPPLDAIGLEPSDQSFPMTRGGSGRHRQGSGSVATPRQPSVGLGFGPTPGFGKPGVANPFNMGNMGNFATIGAATKLSSDDRFRASSTSGGSASMQFGRPTQMQRTASQGGPGATPLGNNRTRSKRGEKRNDGNKVGGGGGGQQGHASGFNNSAPSGSMGQGNAPLEAIAPLRQSANRWDRKTVGTVDPDSPEIVDRKVKGLLNKLTMEKFDSISDQIITWANKSEKEKDGRTLIQVIRLVFEKATDEATWSEMYARLCRKMMEQISPKVQDDGIKNAEGKPIAGGQLFRKYLLNRCQEDFERGWVAKEATAAAAATKAMEDQAAKAANEQSKDGETGDEIVLYSEEYYAAQKAKRQGLGLIKFIGELFKLQMLTERIMHECVKKLLGNVENPEEEEIESLCKLLTTVGAILDTNKARAHMDVYFSRMKELTKSANVSSRMQFMLQDVIELRDRRWVSRNLVAAPTTIAQIHEAAAKEKAAQDKESYQRQMSMSRGGSRRGGERGGEFSQTGPDGWAVAGGSGPPRPPPKAGDLSNFGKISKATPMTFGPSSVFAGKKDGKREPPLSRTSSSQNMFSMLSQNPEAPAEASASKSSRPPSRQTSVDFSQTGVPDAPPQRKRLILQPRSKPTVEETAPAADSESSSEDEAGYPAVEMTEPEAKKKIDEDSKEFFGVRNLDEAELYFTNLPVQHHFRLVDKLVSSAIESKEADAKLVADFLTRATTKDLCSAVAFEEGFVPTAEMLDDIAIDAPKAFDLMAIMVNGAGLDEERRARIASKSVDNSEKLLVLLS